METLKEKHQSWMPKWIVSIGTGFSLLFMGLLLFSILGKHVIKDEVFRIALIVIASLGLGVFIFLTSASLTMRKKFAYQNKNGIARKIIDSLAEYANLAKGEKGLDVGCGSGSLVIACAKKNPEALFIGIDRWGKEYEYSKQLCENNAKVNNVTNVIFQKGDATKLDFPSETFDLVMSNLVYHNIPRNRQDLLLETLRTLKKGGTFVIHDIMNKLFYGDMTSFVNRLREMGYESVELIDTDKGKFVNKFLAGFIFLKGSKLLVGKK